MERLKSRKFILTVVSSALVALAQAFDVQVDPEQLYSLVGLVGAYVLGESAVDRARVNAEIAAGVDRLKLEANTIITALNQKLEELQAAPDGS